MSIAPSTMLMQPQGHMKSVVVFGEALVDLFVAEAGMTLVDAPSLVPHLGGAPANVAVQLARLGTRVELWTAVGDDAFGLRARKMLDDEGVDTRRIKTLPGRKTGLTFVEVDQGGERRFVPRRDHAADQAVTRETFPTTALSRAALFHHGTVSLRSTSSRAATRHFVSAARAAGVMVSLDVNLRFGMFPSREGLFDLARKAVGRADIVKATDEEARLVVGGRNRMARIDRLLENGASLVFLTLDEEGAMIATSSHRVHVPAQKVVVRDATGAGDAFLGAALSSLLGHAKKREELAVLDEKTLFHIGALGCRAGAEAVTELGATTAMMRRGTTPRASS